MLAIPLWVDRMSISESWGINVHTVWFANLLSMLWQCKLVSGLANRSALPYVFCGSGRT